MVDRFEKFSVLIFEISKSWHRIANLEMKKYGLRGPYAIYFTTLYKNPSGITEANLAGICGRDKSDVSRAVKLLENKGLITKKYNNNNSYRASLILTDEGNKIAEGINDSVQSFVKIGGRGLEDGQRTLFYKCLETISGNLRSQNI